MKNFGVLLFSFLCMGMMQSQQTNNEDAFKLIEVWLEAQKDFEDLPGLSAAIIDDQKVLWSGAVGYANPEQNIKANAETLCSICSISKLFTAVAVMQLYEQGKLRLDDSVSDLLPNYNLKQQYADSGPITVRTLLTHSSGLPRESAHPYWTGPDFPFPSREEIAAELGKQQTLYPASTYFQYSNLGLTLLGEIVAEVSGQDYNTYIKENILDPLGLKDTRTELPEALYGKELAVGYSAQQRNRQREKVNFFQARGITPAAGFSSHVLDLGKFASWQFRLRDTTVAEILKPATLKYMQQVHWTNPDWSTTWGLGFVVFKGPDGTTWAGHGGSCPGYRSTLQLQLKRKRAIAVMINSSGTTPNKYARGMNAILGKTERLSQETSKDLSDYVGFYNSQPWWSESYMGSWNGKLVSLDLPSDNPGNSMTFFKHLEGDTFQRLRDDGAAGETITFQRDASGKVISYEQHGNYAPRLNR